MKTVQINGQSYAALLNLRAAKIYEELTGKDISQLSTVTELGAFVYACISAAAKKESAKEPVTYDYVIDNLAFDEVEGIVAELMPTASGE